MCPSAWETEKEAEHPALIFGFNFSAVLSISCGKWFVPLTIIKSLLLPQMNNSLLWRNPRSPVDKYSFEPFIYNNFMIIFYFIFIYYIIIYLFIERNKKKKEIGKRKGKMKKEKEEDDERKKKAIKKDQVKKKKKKKIER